MTMPTPEHLRWITCELAIAQLASLGQPGGRAQLNKMLAPWFPDVDMHEAKAIGDLAADHFEAFAMWLRRHSNRQIDAGRMKEGRYPE